MRALDKSANLEAWTARRLAIESDTSRIPRQRPAYRLLKAFLRSTGLYTRGYQNFLALRMVEQIHKLYHWPTKLDGFSILHLSDLHLDLDEALLPAILRAVEGTAFDMAVITGDFFEKCQAPTVEKLDNLKRLLRKIQVGPYGSYAVLGNHDSLTLVNALEGTGLHFLNNDAAVIPTSTPFALAGVDDAFVFGTHDLQRASAQCPADMPRILLSHSPQLYAQAATEQFSLMLSGHTHGGQICLPGERPIIQLPNIPRSVYKGKWSYETLTGYTSHGAGACHLPVRFNCPPEVTLHRLESL